MPIRRELRHFYGPVWRKITRPRILARANNKCEQCGKLNAAIIQTVTMGDAMWWRPDPFTFQDANPKGKALPWTNERGRAYPKIVFISNIRCVIVVLTIAHLNHVAGDDRDDNLKALCQWCHLNYDLDHHHLTRAARKDAARPLLNPPNSTPMKEANLWLK